MKALRTSVSLPEDLMLLARKDAQASAVKFSTYVRLLIEQRLGVAHKPPQLAQQGDRQ
jgi:hypothetical protein